MLGREGVVLPNAVNVAVVVKLLGQLQIKPAIAVFVLPLSDVPVSLQVLIILKPEPWIDNSQVSLHEPSEERVSGVDTPTFTPLLVPQVPQPQKIVCVHFTLYAGPQQLALGR